MGHSLAQQLLNCSQPLPELSLWGTEPSYMQQAAARASSVPCFCISIWRLFSAGVGGMEAEATPCKCPAAFQCHHIPTTSTHWPLGKGQLGAGSQQMLQERGPLQPPTCILSSGSSVFMASISRA